MSLRPSIPYSGCRRPSSSSWQRSLEPAHEVPGLVLETDVDQSVERQRRVPEPGVTVVPVPLSPDPLGQTHRGGGDERARRIVDHELEDEHGPVYYLPPPSLIGAVREPASPVVQGALQQLFESDVGEYLSWALAPLQMRQDKRRPLARTEREVRISSAFRPVLQPHVGRQPQTIAPPTRRQPLTSRRRPNGRSGRNRRRAGTRRGNPSSPMTRTLRTSLCRSPGRVTIGMKSRVSARPSVEKKRVRSTLVSGR